MAETFYSQISANKRNSFLLTLVIVVLFALLGFSIGYAIGGEVTSASRIELRRFAAIWL